MSESPLRVALLGCGVVGTAVAALMTKQADDLCSRVGAPLELIGIAVHRLEAERDPAIDRHLLTADAENLVDRADIVIELIGGVEPARGLILRAFAHGASVVSANKALLAQHGPELYAAAARAGADLCYEAAVAAAIPILRPVRESLAGDQITRIAGIVNGTTNFVLGAMSDDGLSFSKAVRQAQNLGYAEADPTADVEGFDAAAKIAILASLAFHSRVSLDDVHREGIGAITDRDVAAAAAKGYVIKPLAIAERRRADGVEGVVARVHPALVPVNHPLARARGVSNVITVQARSAGELAFYGPGAGGPATASAVVGDVVSAARHRVHGGREPGESAYAALPVWPVDALHSRYYVRIVNDGQAGQGDALAAVTQIFAAGGVRVASASVQRIPPDSSGGGEDGRSELLIMTEAAGDQAMRRVLAGLAASQAVGGVASLIRVEGE